MKKFLIVGAAVLLVLKAGAPVFAADMPVKAPSPAATPLFDWTGFYGGLNAGYSWGRTNVDYSQDPANFGTGGPTSLSRRLSPSGFIGGGQAGYNYQTGVWVYGVETDIAWRHRKDTNSTILNGLNDTLTLSDTQDWFGTLRGRIGVTPAGNWLLYATGGLAYGRFEHSVTQFCDLLCGQIRTFSNSPVRIGWTVGGGVEVALNRNWSVGAEYLYMDFNRATLSAPAGGAFSDTSASFNDHSHVVRVKLNFRPN